MDGNRGSQAVQVTGWLALAIGCATLRQSGSSSESLETSRGPAAKASLSSSMKALHILKIT